MAQVALFVDQIPHARPSLNDDRALCIRNRYTLPVSSISHDQSTGYMKPHTSIRPPRPPTLRPRPHKGTPRLPRHPNRTNQTPASAPRTSSSSPCADCTPLHHFRLRPHLPAHSPPSSSLLPGANPTLRPTLARLAASSSLGSAIRSGLKRLASLTASALGPSLVAGRAAAAACARGRAGTGGMSEEGFRRREVEPTGAVAVEMVE